MVCYGWFFDFTILHYRTYDLRRRTNHGEAARKTSCLGGHEEDENTADSNGEQTNFGVRDGSPPRQGSLLAEEMYDIFVALVSVDPSRTCAV